jgi:hypothetical protein
MFVKLSWKPLFDISGSAFVTSAVSYLVLANHCPFRALLVAKTGKKRSGGDK